jgi:hypothetical protein
LHRHVEVVSRHVDEIAVDAGVGLDANDGFVAHRHVGADDQVGRLQRVRKRRVGEKAEGITLGVDAESKDHAVLDLGRDHVIEMRVDIADVAERGIALLGPRIAGIAALHAEFL